MTVESAAARLTGAVEALWASVSELMLIIAEDQPRHDDAGPGLAAADDLVEIASEIQADVAAARSLLERAGADGSLVWARVRDHLSRSERSFRRQLGSHRPMARLRSAVRRKGGEWPAWCGTVEISAEQCQDRFDAVDDALSGCLHELVQITALSLRRPALSSPAVETSESQQNRSIS